MEHKVWGQVLVGAEALLQQLSFCAMSRTFRNALRHRDPWRGACLLDPPRLNAAKAAKLLESWLLVRTKTRAAMSSSPPRQSCWAKPEAGMSRFTHIALVLHSNSGSGRLWGPG